MSEIGEAEREQQDIEELEKLVRKLLSAFPTWLLKEEIERREKSGKQVHVST